jgi:hypothetical protein
VDCNGHGTTKDEDKTDGCICACEGGFTGDNCAMPPPCTAQDCNSHGTTFDRDKTDGCECECTDNFSGEDCSAPPMGCDALSDCNGHGTAKDLDSNPQWPGTCTCTMTSDNDIDYVYVDGVDVTHQLTNYNDLGNWPTNNQLTFEIGCHTSMEVL